MIHSVPPVAQCLRYMEQYEMLDNIRAHSFVVARVAEVLVEGLGQAAIDAVADKETVIAGALLHDIAKTRCIETNCHHAREGQKICDELGYPEIGEIVVEHVVLKDFCEDLYSQGIFGVKELVFYADKRVMHDQVVSLDQRLDYILGRYGNNDPLKEQHIRLNFNKTVTLERHLFAHLDFSVKDLARLISEYDSPLKHYTFL